MEGPIADIIYSMPMIALDNVNDDSFLIRKDYKYIGTRNHLTDILKSLNGQWSVLDVNGTRIQSYFSQYLDTTDLKSYHDHHNQRRKRVKHRFRKYGDNGATFFEIKTKTNKEITFKQRTPVPSMEMTPALEQFVESHTDASPKLSHNVQVRYKRVTLFRNETKEKITIDTELSVANGNKQKNFGDLMILELKQDYYNGNLSTRHLMRQSPLISTSISKYCLGVIHCIGNVKTNRFKQRSRIIRKLEKAS